MCVQTLRNYIGGRTRTASALSEFNTFSGVGGRYIFKMYKTLAESGFNVSVVQTKFKTRNRFIANKPIRRDVYTVRGEEKSYEHTV